MKPFSGPKKTNPIQTQFQRQKMLLHLTINGRRKSFGYYADEIEAAKAGLFCWHLNPNLVKCVFVEILIVLLIPKSGDE